MRECVAGEEDHKANDADALPNYIRSAKVKELTNAPMKFFITRPVEHTIMTQLRKECIVVQMSATVLLPVSSLH
jgi:hypothetical protein